MPVRLGGSTVSRTASLGIALADPTTDISAEELLSHADAALYSAKAAGRNRATLFDADLRHAVQDRSETEVLLRDVIDKGGLRLHYHPEVDLRTGRVLAVEALVRWSHPDKGLLPASAFITVAEESGLVVDLGKWVLGEACRQLSVWRSQLPDLDLVVRVNVSPAQLVSPSFLPLVEGTLSTFGVEPSWLSLEVTEHAVMQDLDRSLALLVRLRDLGVGIAIDDFGTGFSSMAQLKRLPIDTVKIDRGFVSGLGHDPADEAIIDSIVRLSTAFGLELVAEGVEEPQHVQRLIELGCWRGQGFGLALPAPLRTSPRFSSTGASNCPSSTWSSPSRPPTQDVSSLSGCWLGTPDETARQRPRVLTIFEGDLAVGDGGAVTVDVLKQTPAARGQVEAEPGRVQPHPV